MRTNRGFAKDSRGTAGALILPAAAFLLIAGIGAMRTYMNPAPQPTGSQDEMSFSLSHAGVDGEVLANLRHYVGSSKTGASATTGVAGDLLPDIDTMTERLAARLKTTPEDPEGWRMLGWSYFNTARYELAAAAYARALALDPDSADLKRSYEEAKAKASQSDRLETASLPSGDEAIPPHERDAQIRSMVDGLANRLENSPRDVDGWTLLMRSRIVLGETEIATATFRKALDIFKDDSAASGKITAAAIALGLRPK